METRKLLEEQNPFFVPLDEDVASRVTKIFKVKEEERMNKRRDREEDKAKKVWDKGGKLSKKQNIKQEIKRIAVEVNEEDQAEKKEIGLIEAADNALKNRVIQRDQMQKFIEKKREMFLMQMTIDQKKEQIKQLEELISIKKKGLEKAERHIEDDLDKFNSHLKANKDQANSSTKEAAQTAENKNKASKILKELRDKKANKISLNTKELEKLEQLYKYKLFLDELADKHLITIKNAEMQERIQENRQEGNREIDLKSHYSSNLVSPGLSDLINDTLDVYEPCFKNPYEITKKFRDMEEMNLILITTQQDTEKEKEDLQNQLDQLNEKYEKEFEMLERKRDSLKQSIEEKKSKMVSLEKVRIGSVQEIKTESANLFDQIKKTCEVMGKKKELPSIQLMTVAACDAGARELGAQTAGPDQRAAAEHEGCCDGRVQQAEEAEEPRDDHRARPAAGERAGREEPRVRRGEAAGQERHVQVVHRRERSRDQRPAG